MRGLIYKKPADLLETGERLKGNEPGINTVANNTILAKHISAIHEGKKPFKCDICDYRSSQKGCMNTHVASVHEGKKPFKCDICDYRCSQKGYMKQHISIRPDFNSA